ncbi:MAG: hypothetical protein K8S54_06025 [Spirochaetia bacterium]|nr:hypothetical protein [Spirochaetia bacterium]
MNARLLQVSILLGGLIFFGACPASGGGSDSTGLLVLLGLGGSSSGPTPVYTVSGTVTGLAGGETVTVQLNGSAAKTLSSNSSFTFATELKNAQTYSVQVSGVTGGTNCMASNNTGTIASSNVTNVNVHCNVTTAQLRVNVTGLYGGNTVVFQNNGSNNLSVTTNGVSNFTTLVPVGAGYSVMVSTQPGPNSQTCTPSANTGTMAAATTTIAVACSPDYFTISGTYSGLAGSGLQIRVNNTGETLTKSVGTTGASNTITFSTPVAAGTNYAVVVSQNPSVLNQTCTVTNGSGTNIAANVTNVSVACVTSAMSVGGSISGMSSGDSVVLLLNGGSNLSVLQASPSFSWNVTDGTGYTVSVMTHAAGKTCSVTNGTGTVASANVTNITVSCAFNTYTVGGNVSGLCTGQSITVLNNSGNGQTVSGSGSFTFPAQNDLSSYSVTVSSGSVPSGVSCNVTSGSSNVAGANVTNVAVACSGCMSCAGSATMTVNWSASRSYDVTTASGGGHKIYFATSTGVTTSSAGFKDIPNTTSTTQGVITGRSTGCTYFVKILPYSSINSTGGTLSGESSITIP